MEKEDQIEENKNEENQEENQEAEAMADVGEVIVSGPELNIKTLKEMMIKANQ